MTNKQSDLSDDPWGDAPTPVKTTPVVAKPTAPATPAADDGWGMDPVAPAVAKVDDAEWGSTTPTPVPVATQAPAVAAVAQDATQSVTEQAVESHGQPEHAATTVTARKIPLAKVAMGVGALVLVVYTSFWALTHKTTKASAPTPAASAASAPSTPASVVAPMMEEAPAVPPPMEAPAVAPIAAPTVQPASAPASTPAPVVKAVEPTPPVAGQSFPVPPPPVKDVTHAGILPPPPPSVVVQEKKAEPVKVETPKPTAAASLQSNTGKAASTPVKTKKADDWDEAQRKMDAFLKQQNGR